MVSRDTRYVVAALQALVGYEWLVSGANKVLSGTFPQGLANILRDGIKENPNGWYVAFLQRIIIPHSVFFGYLIEVAEILVALALLCGAALLVGRLRQRGEPQYWLQVSQIAGAALAALTCALLCVNFHFFIGDGIVSALDSTRPFDEGIDLDTLLPPIALLIAFVNLRLLRDITGSSLRSHVAHLWQHTLAFIVRDAAEMPSYSTEDSSPSVD